MSRDHPEALQIRARQVLEEIYRAFADVNRTGGVSWSESRVVDFNGSVAERAAARSRDVESGWPELVDDEEWDPEMGVGGWSFLDPVGFRYYLPAAMARSVKSGYNVGIEFHLSLPKYWLRKHTLEKWSALNVVQCLCIKHFIEFMVALSELDPCELPSLRIGPITLKLPSWRQTLSSYWADLDDNPDSNRSP